MLKAIANRSFATKATFKSLGKDKDFLTSVFSY